MNSERKMDGRLNGKDIRNKEKERNLLRMARINQ